MRRELDIMGTKVPVIWASSMPEDAVATWDPDTMEIHISNQISAEHQRQALIHELLHAVSEFLNLDLSHAQIYPLTMVLVHFLRANTGTVEWLQQS